MTGYPTYICSTPKKIIILEVINLAFGDSVLFLGAIHGLVAFIVVVIVMLVAEQAIVKFYKSLA